MAEVHGNPVKLHNPLTWDEFLAIVKDHIASTKDNTRDELMRRNLDQLLSLFSLAPIPTPSPIDAAGMREACAKYLEQMAEDADAGVSMRGPAYRKAAQEIRALPTPAREIDREKIATAFAKDFPAVLAQYSQYKIIDWFLSLIGGRHV